MHIHELPAHYLSIPKISSTALQSPWVQGSLWKSCVGKAMQVKLLTLLNSFLVLWQTGVPSMSVTRPSRGDLLFVWLPLTSRPPLGAEKVESGEEKSPFTAKMPMHFPSVLVILKRHEKVNAKTTAIKHIRYLFSLVQAYFPLWFCSVPIGAILTLLEEMPSHPLGFFYFEKILEPGNVEYCISLIQNHCTVYIRA